MTTKSKLSFHNGFEIYKSNNIKLLTKLRNDIYFEMKKVFKLSEKNPEKGFNHFHKAVGNLSSKDLNEKRKKLINTVTKKLILEKLFLKHLKNIWLII